MCWKGAATLQVITPRATRLIRVAHLEAFRAALSALASEGSPLAARDRLVVVPTRAAAAHLLRTIEDRECGADRQTIILPDFVTARELVPSLERRLPAARPSLARAEREALLGVACRMARDAGTPPPFRLRPGLIAEILHFYDTLRCNGKDLDSFERLALAALEPGAAYDRGAERLVRQTVFLVAAFRAFEQLSAQHGDDEHAVRARLIGEASDRPYRHVIVTVSDRGFDPHGLHAADWDLLSRIPGLERLDVVVTDTMLAGALHEHMHRVLPGIEEARFDLADASPQPILVIPPAGGLVHVARDREEEVAGFARRVKALVRGGHLRALGSAALVVHRPLPYVYVAREVLRSGGVPCQTFDALPLGAEPYAAALDLVLSVAAADFARGPSIALLSSAHFSWLVREGEVDRDDVMALDRALAEAGYLGGHEALGRLLDDWRAVLGAADPASPRRGHGVIARAVRAGTLLATLARQLLPLRTDAPLARHLAVIAAFLQQHESGPPDEEPIRARHHRARAAILGMLRELHDAYDRFDDAPVGIDEVVSLVRRWIEGHTFAPRQGDAGVHLVDAASAPFGTFSDVQLAGLVEGEWPDQGRRNVFYSPAILRDLGWPADAQRRESARAAFADLLRLPSQRLVVSTFSLEADAIVSPSILIEAVDAVGLDAVEESHAPHRVFDHEALSLPPVEPAAVPDDVRGWVAARLEGPRADDLRYRGRTQPHAQPAYSLSALERYQDCPFKFFASEVLRLEEVPEDESALSPRARGRFIHEVFQRFYEAWDQSGRGTITVPLLDDARLLFAQVAEPLLATLRESDAALERTRLFGSAISTGIVDVVLGLEAAHPVDVKERWLEYRLEGEFALGSADGPRVPLRGVADRIDLLAGRRLRVIDYKTGSAPNPKRALQVPIYALCAQERLGERDSAPWDVDEAAYVAFSGKRTLVQVVKASGNDRTAPLGAARARVLEVLDGIAGGDFTARPHDPMMCRYCPYPTVCRKDYIEDE